MIRGGRCRSSQPHTGKALGRRDEYRRGGSKEKGRRGCEGNYKE
jgi:hypothetical protein